MKFDLSKVKISYVDRKEGLTLPQETSVELAEFIGILAGDGHVGHHTDYHHSVEISGHKIDDIEYKLERFLERLEKIESGLGKK